MIDELKQIDQILRKCEKDTGFVQDRHMLINLTQEELKSYAEKESKSSLIVQDMQVRFQSLSQSLLPDEVVTAYIESGRLFRQILSFYIYENFTDEFIPIAHFAVNEDHEVAYRILANLSKPSETLYECVDKILDSRWRMNVELGLGIVKARKLSQFTPKVKRLTKNNVVSDYADDVLISLTNSA